MPEHRMGLYQGLKVYKAALSRTDYPKNSICAYHGLGFQWNHSWVGFYSHGDARTLITVYSSHYISHEHVTLPKKWHNNVKMLASKALGVKLATSWNGRAGNSGVSVVMKIAFPVLEYVNARYKAMPNILNPTPEEEKGFHDFDVWLKAAVADAAR